MAVCFGWFILGSVHSVAAGFPSGGKFSDSFFVELITLEVVLGGVALTFLRARGYSIEGLLPTPSWLGCLLGLALFVAASAAWWAVAQAFPRSEFAHQPIAEMVSNTSVSLPFVVALSMVNGLYEEVFLVGYLVRGFRASGASVAIGLSLLVRVLYHLYQGPLGAVSVLVFGLVITVFYWRTQRLWPVVFAHTLADAVAFA